MPPKSFVILRVLCGLRTWDSSFPYAEELSTSSAPTSALPSAPTRKRYQTTIVTSEKTKIIVETALISRGDAAAEASPDFQGQGIVAADQEEADCNLVHRKCEDQQRRADDGQLLSWAPSRARTSASNLRRGRARPLPGRGRVSAGQRKLRSLPRRSTRSRGPGRSSAG